MYQNKGLVVREVLKNYENTHPSDTEQYADTASQDKSFEPDTNTEQETPFEGNDIDKLLRQADELRDLEEVQQGFERDIIGAGLHIMAKRYGTAKLLDLLRKGGDVTSFRSVVEGLVSEETERQALYESIKNKPIDELAEHFNQTLGDVVYESAQLSAMEHIRRFDSFVLRGPIKRALGRVVDRIAQTSDNGEISNTGVYSPAPLTTFLTLTLR